MKTLDKRTAPTLRAIAIVLLTVGGAALLAAAEASSQAASSSSAFEVATIGANTSGSRARSLGYPPNRFVATNMPLKWFIGNAYGDALPFRQDMIFGGPSWIDSEGYDVEAKASSIGTSPDDQIGLARCRDPQVDVAETSRGPVRARVAHGDARARAIRPRDGQGGPKARASTRVVRWKGLRDEAGGDFVTMADIGKTLGQFLDSPVLDKTGLSGRFTFELTFTPPSTVTPAPGVPPPDPDVASIFTAVQEHLGSSSSPSGVSSKC